MDALDAILQSPDATVVLTRHITITLLDISRSGCLLRADRRLDEGVTGVLRVSFDDAEYVDEIRIVRCQQPTSGGHGFGLGAQFLWVSHPGDRSLRRLIGTLEPQTPISATLGFELRADH